MKDETGKGMDTARTNIYQFPCDVYPPPNTRESCEELTDLTRRLLELSYALARSLECDMPIEVLRHYPAAVESIASQISQISDRIKFLENPP